MSKKRVYTLQSKKVHNSNSLTFKQAEFLMEIKGGNGISKICRKLKITRRSGYKRINSLIRKGLARKEGYGIYTLTPKSATLLKKVYTSKSDEIRSNNVRFHIKILSKPKNWNERRARVLISKHRGYRQNKANDTIQFNQESIKIILGRDNIQFIMPRLITKTPFEAFEQNLQMLLDTIPILENDFKILLIKDRYCNMKIITQEYAMIDNSLAKKYRKEGSKLFIPDKDGKIWLIIDHSWEDELEGIDAIRSPDDMQSIQKFFNDHRQNPRTLTDLQREYMAAFDMMAKNYISHINLIKEVKKLIRDIRKSK